MECLPLFQADPNPEAINAKGYDSQKKPLDPVAEQLHGGTSEFQAMAVDDCVLCLPVIDHTTSPGVADAKSQAGHKEAQQVPTDKLEQSAVKIRFGHKTPQKNQVYAGSGA